MSWQNEKAWSDQFLHEIKAVLGQQLIGEIKEEDQSRNTDLIVLKLDSVRVACRVRRHKYLAQYGSEFTMRSKLPTGTKTELAKVVEGWGDYIFYAFADDGDARLAQWLLGSLNVFRLWFSRQLAKNAGRPPFQPQSNRDGSSEFAVFKIGELPGEFIHAWGP